MINSVVINHHKYLVGVSHIIDSLLQHYHMMSNHKELEALKCQMSSVSTNKKWSPRVHLNWWRSSKSSLMGWLSPKRSCILYLWYLIPTRSLCLSWYALQAPLLLSRSLPLMFWLWSRWFESLLSSMLEFSKRQVLTSLIVVLEFLSSLLRFPMNLPHNLSLLECHSQNIRLCHTK